MEHYGYVVMKFPVNKGKRLNYSHKALHNHTIIEILESMDPSLLYVGSLNTSQSITEGHTDLLFDELCHLKGERQLDKVIKYVHKLNRTNPYTKG